MFWTSCAIFGVLIIYTICWEITSSRERSHIEIFGLSILSSPIFTSQILRWNLWYSSYAIYWWNISTDVASIHKAAHHMMRAWTHRWSTRHFSIQLICLFRTILCLARVSLLHFILLFLFMISRQYILLLIFDIKIKKVSLSILIWIFDNVFLCYLVHIVFAEFLLLEIHIFNDCISVMLIVRNLLDHFFYFKLAEFWSDNYNSNWIINLL